MIVREILKNPALADNFDYFNDYNDTSSWLKGCKPSEQRETAIARLEQGFIKYIQGDHMPQQHARFGVSEIQGEDENEGDIWFQIGLIEVEDGIETVPEEMSVVMMRNAEENEKRFPGIRERKLKSAQIIAEALTEYAENHGLADGWFHANTW